MTALRLYVDGIGFWHDRLPGWDAARAAFRGEGALLDAPLKRPAPQLLAPAERRRATDLVSIALEVATHAVEQSGLAADRMPSVFVSAHGDLTINDYMCRTLATEPTAISPTRFHNSVHNAAAGYWTMATGCREASSASSAHEQSFAAGLLEAATQCLADRQPVLLVGCDVIAVGALSSVTKSEGLLAVALVLSPERRAQSVAAIDWSLKPGPALKLPLASAAARSLGGNAMSEAVPLFEALALRKASALAMPLSSRLSFDLHLKDFT